MIIKYFAMIKGSRGFKTCLECSNQQNLIGLRHRRKGSYHFKTCLKGSNQQNLIGLRRRRTGILICVLPNILFDFVRHSELPNFFWMVKWNGPEKMIGRNLIYHFDSSTQLPSINNSTRFIIKSSLNAICLEQDSILVYKFQPKNN